MKNIDLVIAQVARESNDVQKNVMRSIKIISNVETPEEKPDSPTLVLFPELWITQKILEPDEFLELTMPLFFLSVEKGVWIQTGAHYVRNRKGEVRSISTIITPKGEHIVMSEKSFPSKPMGERGNILPGNILGVVNVGNARVGSVICVDAMYPEVSRVLSLKGAELLVNPSSIPENRKDLWKSIARTRAAENTVFWASILLTGTQYPDGRAVSGGSLVVGPSGNIIYESGPRLEAGRIVLDLSQIESQRDRWPYLVDVRERGILSRFVNSVGKSIDVNEYLENG